MSDSRAIFHLTSPEVWEAQRRGVLFTESTRGATVDQVGYIHCSYVEQVELVANAIYLADWPGELLLLEIDTALITAAIKVENLDGGDMLFPHIYGSLPVAAVVAVHGMVRDGDRWKLSVVMGEQHPLPED